ncbi:MULTISPECIES: hypothetical protein [Brucella/Ochrobactrum group]|uniref:hypothetical protein n=1 Tax=Brucella/Ochrobactrum group TaxID=2826938 RepID=UPI000DEFD06D|nr:MULTISPECIES: hypothetical protein [Brucella/Ochrobactrum group]MCH6203438.1 hypothetical protein [Brucella ciceri]
MATASALLTGGSLLLSGIGGAIGYNQQAQQAKNAAATGRIQANQIDAGYRDELNSTINNIRAIRAGTGVAADSPTTMAIENENERVNEQNRSRDVASRRIQADQSERDAKTFRNSAFTSLLGGTAKSLPYFFGM